MSGPRLLLDDKMTRAALMQILEWCFEEIKRMRAGEFICTRCYLRKDGEKNDAITF